MNETGSFGNSIGGAGALKAAMQRRGIDSSILDQVSPASAGPQSPVSPAIPQDAPNVAPSIDQTLQPPQQTASKQPARSAEMDIALKALSGVVKTESKIAEASLGLNNLI